jgi:RNA polymerase primary sigma factor
MNRDYASSIAAVEYYLKEIACYPLLSREEEMAVALKAQHGDKEARQTLVQANLRLVVKIALEYVGLGLPLPDLISEGNIGVVRASELFDPHVGAKFSTYAALWIKQRIRRAITNQAKTVRVPIWKNQMLRRLQVSTDELSSQLGRAPTESEVSMQSGISSVEMERLRNGSIQITSLDAPLGNAEDAGATVGSVIPDENTDCPGESLRQNEILLDAMASLNTLSDKELKILTLRFGLNGEEEQTLDSIGKLFKVSRERIRQLQEAALDKLRQKLLEDVEELTETKRREALRKVSQRMVSLAER